MSPVGSTCWHSVTMRGLAAAESAGSHGMSVPIRRSRSALRGKVTSLPCRRRAAVFSTRGSSEFAAVPFLAAGKILLHDADATRRSASRLAVRCRLVIDVGSIGFAPREPSYETPPTAGPPNYCASLFDTSTMTAPPSAFSPNRAVAASAFR